MAVVLPRRGDRTTAAPTELTQLALAAYQARAEAAGNHRSAVRFLGRPKRIGFLRSSGGGRRDCRPRRRIRFGNGQTMNCQRRTYIERPFPRNRNLIVDILRAGAKKHHINSFHAIDVSLPRTSIRNHQRETGEKLSFTAFLVKCMAQAVNEHRHIQTFLQGTIRRRLVTFEDVDVATFIERDLGNGQTFPTIYVVRHAQKKSVSEISAEIRAAQGQKGVDAISSGQNIPLKGRILASLPTFLRKIAWWALMRIPDCSSVISER